MVKGILHVIEKLQSMGFHLEAQGLKVLAEKQAPAPELLKECGRLKEASLLPESALFCITADLAEELASRAADNQLGTWEEFDQNCTDLQDELLKRIVETVSQFLELHPLPQHYVCEALRFAKEDYDRQHTVPDHNAQLIALASALVPQKLREDLDCPDMADLLQRAPHDFRKKKQEGERYLIGQTYDEQAAAFQATFLGEPKTQSRE